MATKYFALLTNIGAAKLANATALGAKVEITQMAVGDGNGALPTPNPAQTALTHELRRAQLNMLTIDPVNTNQIIAEQVIPEDVGGWWIREIGLFDKNGDMIAVANCAETYKPQLQEGSGRVQVIRVILIVSSTEAITLKIDPSVVLATRKYVDDAVIEVKGYADGVMKKHVEAVNPHSQYPLISNALKEMKDAGLTDKVLKNLSLADSNGYVGRLIGVRTITSSGTYTPTPGTKSIIVEVQGAGGGGGGASSVPGQCSAGCGGQSGTYIKHRITNLATSYECVIGTGGTGGNGATPGNVGGSTSFAGLIAYGGGAGGTTTGAGVNLAFIVTPAQVPMGGNIINAGSSSGDGAMIFNSTTSKSGVGGSSSMGGGGGQRGTSGAGVNASGYGSGGSGANSVNGGGSFIGGNGSNGCVIVWEFA